MMLITKEGDIFEVPLENNFPDHWGGQQEAPL